MSTPSRNGQQKLVSAGIFGFIILILLVIFSNATLLTIDPGEKGVLFQRFSGGLSEKIYNPGFHIIAPWNVMYKYDVRETQLEEQMEIMSSNGLNIKVDITVRVNPDHLSVNKLHEQFGPQYVERLVRPEVRSAVRQVLGQFTPEELYSTRRDEVQTLIQQNLETSLAEDYIVLQATLIRDIELPDKVKGAIEEKLEAEQGALKYEYILQQERQEAQRRIIEAEAKAEANRILSASITPNILKERGIEATIELASSPNTKVIIVGSEASDGLPLILGGG